MRSVNDEGQTPAVALFKGVLAYLIMRDLPDLPTPDVHKVVREAVAAHGHESITAENSLRIIDEAMGAAHATADMRSTT